jgi:hypothetical protein
LSNSKRIKSGVGKSVLNSSFGSINRKPHRGAKTHGFSDIEFVCGGLSDLFHSHIHLMG